MVKLKSMLRSAGLVPLLTLTLYSCGEALSPTIVPTSPPTAAIPVPTSTLTAAQPEAALSSDDIGTLSGLPVGVFHNSQTTPFDQVPPKPVGIQSAGVLGAQSLGVPKWVKPGTRITFYAAAATIVSRGDPTCKEDPNGEWDDNTGKKYSCTGMPGDPDGSSSGDGLSQVDVLAVEGTDVVLSTTLFGINHIDNQYTVAPTGGGKAPGDVIDGVWVHPTKLAELARTGVEGVKILQGDYTVEGVTYKAISFLSIKPGSYESYVYDTVTGLLVSTTTRTTPTATQPGANGNAQLYIRHLLGYRQRNVPGMNGTNPSWVARTKLLNYNGTWSFTNPMGLNSETLVAPMTLNVTFGKGGKNWLPYTAKSVIDYSGYKQESTGTGVTGSSGQYWIDPKGLAALKKGQVIDTDPHTQEKLVVQSVQKNTAVKTVVISSELPGNRSLLTYDLTTGALIDFQTTSSGTGVTILLLLSPPRQN